MKRRVVATIAALAMLFAFAPVALAGQQYYGCTANSWPNDASRFILYENALGDFSDGYDSLLACNDIPNLHDVAHAPAGTCKGSFFGNPHWGDCASAVYVAVPTGQVFCLFQNPGYSGGHLRAIVGPYSGSFNLGVNSDSASSVGFTPGVSANNCSDM
jgi:hypothetical protein